MIVSEHKTSNQIHIHNVEFKNIVRFRCAINENYIDFGVYASTAISACWELIHCERVTQYDEINLGRHWIR